PDEGGGFFPAVPHGVRLAAGLSDVPACAEQHLAVAGPEPDLALGDDGVLVLAGVQVGRHQSADRERVFHDRYRAARVVAPELERHADRAQMACCTAAWLDDGERRSFDAAHDMPPEFFSVQLCLTN